ncbi:hypothetical protein T484DRAFT_1936915 [Baffinella frigidus]|nr:hypothetical protein T484DRAFT_1936915 [Cryptophyta sp. CCMP2293]
MPHHLREPVFHRAATLPPLCGAAGLWVRGSERRERPLRAVRPWSGCDEGAAPLSEHSAICPTHLEQRTLRSAAAPEPPAPGQDMECSGVGGVSLLPGRAVEQDNLTVDPETERAPLQILEVQRREQHRKSLTILLHRTVLPRARCRVCRLDQDLYSRLARRWRLECASTRPLACQLIALLICYQGCTNAAEPCEYECRDQRY